MARDSAAMSERRSTVRSPFALTYEPCQGYAVAVGEARTASGQHAELRIQRRLMDKFLPIALAAEHPGKIALSAASFNSPLIPDNSI